MAVRRDKGKKKPSSAPPRKAGTRTVKPRLARARRGPESPAAIAAAARDEDAGDAERSDAPLTIVGVGASAGGLEAYSQLLRGLPSDPGLALVLVQHQAPQHESALAELLGAQSRLPVVQATDGLRIERDHAYVSPPNAQIRIEGDVLHLTPRPTDRTQYVPIDIFLRSLADAAQDHGIAIIMSGTASDGTSGVRDVKAAGGITIAQRPESAKYDGMPRAAIASGLVDLVLTPEEMSSALVQMGRHPYLLEHPRELAPKPADREAAEHTKLLDRILMILRSSGGVDFRQYKRPTIDRRVHRRMVLHRLTRLDQYVRLLEESPAEVQALFQDVLILVTRFFRDPEAFEALRSIALPRIVEAHGEDDPIRVWIAGCSTGEEAYSIAMLLLEQMGDRGSSRPIQIFATDISESGIEQARNGVYPASITTDVSPGRLRRFFTKVDGGYRISKTVRDVCIFARQDLTRDPPFSKLDLIVCRNVLIYLNAAVQQKLMSLFHYALKPTGYLMLGTAETIGQHADYFRIDDKRFRIYGKTPMSVTQLGAIPTEYQVPNPLRGRNAVQPQRDDAGGVQNEVNRLIQERFAPPGVIVDADQRIVQFRGHTGAFLEPAPGDPSLNLLRMVREGLLYGLRTALQSARRTSAPVRRDGLRVKHDGGWQECSIEVVPLSASDRPHFLVLFHAEPRPTAAPAQAGPRSSRKPRQAPPAPNGASHMARLEQELESSREYMQSIIQELEAANEELQSANEEVLSANEELQSTNEELDTAKEELQSTNEELNTVNDELRGRNEELSRANSDLENLLASVQIAIVIVARDLRIRRFTPMAERLLNLIPSDIGRPIGHIKPNLDLPDLEACILDVVDTVAAQEHEVRDSQGNWLSLRIRPYKDIENRIDGAVLVLFDAEAARHQAGLLQRSEELGESLLDALPNAAALLDGELRVRSANEAFLQHFATSMAKARGRPVWELEDGAGTLQRLESAVQRMDRAAQGVARVEFEHAFRDGQRRRMLAVLKRFQTEDRDEPRFFLAINERPQ